MQIPRDHVRIAKVVGENEEGLTLFIPKDMDGNFHIEDGDKFLTLIFAKTNGGAGLMTWVPWEEASGG